MSATKRSHLRAQAKLIRALDELEKSSPTTSALIVRLTTVIAQEAASSPKFAAALSGLENPTPVRATVAAKPEPEPAAKPASVDSRRARRTSAKLNPLTLYSTKGEAALKTALAPLEIEQLKDIISEYSMNQDGLAMRWKSKPRLIDRIVTFAADRAA
jgi:hypothetical protein